ADEIVDQPLLHGVPSGFAADNSRDSLAIRADPQGASAVTINVPCRKPAQIRGKLNRLQRLAGYLEEAPVQSGHIQRPAWVLIDRVNALRNPVSGCDGAGCARA